ncbi:MAG: T9SS type A sorting domain-containing protein [Crocinitomicaceae bacterium]|nr:T9SS type A sorting domain-containing protein [Crocinitomicaceae bacterium]MDG1657654.1 T9SS type A sorting domain-containing protein [Crocinitomicaceae bacterium]MDG2441367.1 T9SS type A sorting domain-containing protein [Crocinitomicaceae bacterium]
MIYRYSFVAFLGAISLFLISAGFSTNHTELEAYVPSPPFSGGAGTGGLGDRTGGPLSSATCSQCHSGGTFNVSVSLDVFDPVSGMSVTSYVPGNIYQITFSVSGNASAYGFQGTALTSVNGAGGSFSSPSGAQLVTISGRPYIEHVGGPSASGVFQTDWTAPVAGSGTIMFYGIGLAVNQNGGTSGDNVSATFAGGLSEVVPTTINYPGNPFCANEVNPIASQTGEPGGTFSAPAGLVLSDTLTGEIDLQASVPGMYTIDYTYSSGTTSFNVTILPTYSSSTTATICDNETLSFGSQTLNASNVGLNTEVFQAVNGCDSTVDLTLTVLPTFVENNAATICEGDTYDFNGTILTEANAGLNTTVFQSTSGCDSTVNLTLSIETIDSTVSLSGTTLTTVQIGATYQWVDCDNANAPIPGETNSTYTPTTTGNYAVEITINNCTETSACTLVNVASVNELNIDRGVVFPNPVRDVFEIKNIEQFGSIESILLMDANGRVVQTISVDATSVNIGHLEAGVYFLKISIELGESLITLVKK